LNSSKSDDKNTNVSDDQDELDTDNDDRTYQKPTKRSGKLTMKGEKNRTARPHTNSKATGFLDDILIAEGGLEDSVLEDENSYSAKRFRELRIQMKSSSVGGNKRFVEIIDYSKSNKEMKRCVIMVVAILRMNPQKYLSIRNHLFDDISQISP